MGKWKYMLTAIYRDGRMLIISKHKDAVAVAKAMSKALESVGDYTIEIRNPDMTKLTETEYNHFRWLLMEV